ncbi:MAG: Ig-like domain-containing protein [Thermoplasmata archaeon]
MFVGSNCAVGVWDWSKRGGKAAVVYTITILLLLVLIQWPVGSHSPHNHLPSTSPDQNETTDTDPPAAPLLTSAVLEGPSNENVLLSWELSADDGAGDNDVSHYAIYGHDGYDYDGDGYSYLAQVNSGTTSYLHSLAGDGDPFNDFYYVAANDTSGNSNWSGQAAKFLIPFKTGKQIASVPLVQENTTLEVVLQTLDGSFKHVRYYKSSDQSNHWKSYWTFKTYGTLFDIDHTMGFWIDIVKPDNLVVAGLVPEATQIELGHGWNFVSYPSFIARTLDQALSGVDWVKAQGYDDTPPFNLRQLSGSDVMTAGEGYWIWVDLPQTWEVHNKPTDPPYIVWTDPPDGALDIPLNASIFVKFSKAMNISSVWWSMTPFLAHSTFWGEGDTLLEIQFNESWPEDAAITIEVGGKDLNGNWLAPGPVPNPWTFITVSMPPIIVATYPADGTVGVLFDADIVVGFSEPMDVSTFMWMISPDPDPGGWSSTWSNGNTIVTLSHSFPFAEATLYMVAVTYAEDMSGNALVPGPVPNPFTFVTGSVDPHIVVTDPYNGEVSVELYRNISIWFSEPMDTGSVVWTITPSVPGQWVEEWYDNDTHLLLSHTTPFTECMQYEVDVNDAIDKSGNPLVPGPVSNPWTFTTASTCPYVVLTDPSNNQTNVSIWQAIWIEFSWSMNMTTLTWSITPDPGAWSEIWPSPMQLYLYHNNSFQPNTTYVFQILYIEDLYGVPLCDLPFTLTFKTSPW